MKENTELMILNEINEANQPVGATYLATKLKLPQTSIGRVLLSLEEDGYLKKVSNKGRVITVKGLHHLEDMQQQSNKDSSFSKFINIVESTSSKKLVEILRIRKLIECLGIEEACQNANESQLEELQDALNDLDNAHNNGFIGNYESIIIHLTIAKISGNQALYQLLRLMINDWNGYAKVFNSSDEGFDDGLERLIVKSIIKRDADTAKQLMIQHLDNTISLLSHDDDNNNEE